MSEYYYIPSYSSYLDDNICGVLEYNLYLDETCLNELDSGHPYESKYTLVGDLLTINL